MIQPCSLPAPTSQHRLLPLSLAVSAALLLAACASGPQQQQQTPQALALPPAMNQLLAAQEAAGLSRADALRRIAARSGLSVEELQQQPDRLDPIAQDLLARFERDTQALITSAQASGQAQAMALALPLLDAPGRFYAWTQFADMAQEPFSTAHITAVTSAVPGTPGQQRGSLEHEVPFSGPEVKAANATATDLSARYAMSDPSLGRGQQVARVVTAAAQCPQMLVDGRPQAMQLRAPAVRGVASNAAAQTGDKRQTIGADFELLTCEATLPPEAQVVGVGGQRLALRPPLAQVNRVVVVGDTGCRVQGPNAFGSGKPGAPLQDCSDESDWPWRKIARAAASFNPDLIIHNGDIHYREGLPKGTEPGQPQPNEARVAAYVDTITYGWKSWEADFFRPAGALLASAPWAITRGNHELCDRAGAGWYRFLDYRRFPEKEPQYSPDYDAAVCSNATDPLLVRLGDLQLILMDVGGLADAPGRGRNQGWTNGDHLRTARQLTAVAKDSGTRSAAVSWLVTHKPLFAFYSGGPKVTSSTWQFQKALQPGVESFGAGNGELPANLQMVHSGHIHGWMMISHPAQTALPTQYLIGNSGQALEGFHFGARGDKPYQAAAPVAQANEIAPQDRRWPWHEAPWSFRLPDGTMAQPDAFSSSPILDAGSKSARSEEFGFVVFDRITGTSNWTARMFDPQRQLLRTCITEGKRTRCEAPAQ